MKNSLLLFAFIYLINSLTAWSDQTELERRLSFSSGYFEHYFNSNEGLVHFPLSVISGYSKLFDVVTSSFSNSWGKRLGSTLIEFPLSFWLAHSLFVPFHEFGHARAALAHGYSYDYGSFGYGREFKDLSNFWELSAIRLITPPFFIPGTGIAYTRSYNNLIPSHENQIIFSAAGLNNQMLLAKKIGQQIYEKNTHMLSLQHYIGNKISGFIYAILDQDNNPNNDLKTNGLSDPAAILSSYQQLGYNINHSDLKMLSLISLLSGSTLSLFEGYYSFITHNDPVVRPLELFGLRIPDINGYINTRGLSFEIESDYRIAPYLSVGLAYEFIWKGKSDYNLSPRVRYNLAHALPTINEMWLKADVVIGRGIGGSFGVDYAPFMLDENSFWSRLAYSADLNVHNANTLYGERNINSVVGGKTVSIDAVLAVHMRY